MKLKWHKFISLFFIILIFPVFTRGNLIVNSLYWPTYDWSVSDPSEQGIDNSTIYEMYDYIEDKKTIIL